MLDPDFINRAVPPGSMRYFAWLYTPAPYRDLLTSLFVIENEIQSSARAAHEVAHTRLQWWRGEIDRLVNRSAQHPATQILQSALPTTDFSLLHELLAAADMDLARMTYHTQTELSAYLTRSGGTIFSLAATSEAHRTRAAELGALVRRVETLRDFHADLRAGRLYWPLDELTQLGIAPERALDSAHREQLLNLLESEANRLVTTLQDSPAPDDYLLARPLNVLAGLHLRLAERIAADKRHVFTKRIELGSLEKNWSAWRSARRS